MTVYVFSRILQTLMLRETSTLNYSVTFEQTALKFGKKKLPEPLNITSFRFIAGLIILKSDYRSMSVWPYPFKPWNCYYYLPNSGVESCWLN